MNTITEDMNKSAILSTMAADLFHNGLNPIDSYKVATAFIGAVPYIEDDMEEFWDEFLDGLELVQVKLQENLDQKATATVEDSKLDMELVNKALVDAHYIRENEDLGIIQLNSRLEDLLLQRTEAYAPTTGEIQRRFNYAPVNYSNLFVEAIHALESTEYTVDKEMLSIALQVQAKLGEDNDAESYVIRGCQAMDSSLGYKSEFKGDRRGRMYQAACHGPIGAASDRSRALQNLYDVPMDYNAKEAYKLILAEMEDMTSNVRAAMTELNSIGEVQFIINNLGEKALVGKPWSFVKAAKIMKQLKAGHRPYIGMAVGLDAKCSGPQIASLMVGDIQIAQACGMSLVEVDDAYKLAQIALEKVGFIGVTRAIIKKPYMGIFYGQGWAAFTNTKSMVNDEMGDLVRVLYGTGPAVDDIAKAFHSTILSSFGNKMNAVRGKIKEYAKVTQGRTKHFLPDGFEVAMNYKIKVNALNELVEYDTKQYDMFITNNTESYKFINMQMKTKAVHTGDFARNGFVNMIQGVDGLIARLIVINLQRLGAKHIISVHDCFRVNINDMELLKKAIKMAYQALFGWVENKKTGDLPKGTDILALYFEGANRQLIEGEEGYMVTQFRATSKKRKMPKIQGHYLSDVIDALGDSKEGGSYYFAK